MDPLSVMHNSNPPRLQNKTIPETAPSGTLTPGSRFTSHDPVVGRWCFHPISHLKKLASGCQVTCLRPCSKKGVELDLEPRFAGTANPEMGQTRPLPLPSWCRSENTEEICVGRFWVHNGCARAELQNVCVHSHDSRKGGTVTSGAGPATHPPWNPPTTHTPPPPEKIAPVNKSGQAGGNTVRGGSWGLGGVPG